MKKTNSSRNQNNDVLTQLIARNQGKLGQYFKKLFNNGLGKWEKRVLALFCRSRAYRDNNLPKLLEIAYDLKIAHEAQINFTEKYFGELFLHKATKMERVEIKFLDQKMIPKLSQYLARNRS